MPMMTFHEAATYAAAYLDGLDHGRGSHVDVDLELNDDVLYAAERRGMDVETFLLSCLVLGMYR